MKDKVLILASVASMIDQFNIPNIEILLSLGYEVHVACNFEKGNTCSQEKIEKLKFKLTLLDVTYYQIEFTRSVFNIDEDIKAYRQVKKLMLMSDYKFIHCHSPIGGVIGRLACKTTKTKCIYTAHGFHFYKGAPLKNWMIYYPIEKWLSRYTDILITINTEDYARAKTKFKMKKVEYVPGVGIDINKFQFKSFDRNSYRKSMGLNDNDYAILSVGELNKNKNHEVVIRSIAKLNNDHIHYFIAGRGESEDYLRNLAKELHLDKQLHILEYRKDIPELLNSCDIYILPSIREGLNVSLMEAMASGLPCIASNIRGNVDLITNKENGFLCDCFDIDSFKTKISEFITNDELIKSFKANTDKKIKNFDCNSVNKMMTAIYINVFSNN